MKVFQGIHDQVSIPELGSLESHKFLEVDHVKLYSNPAIKEGENRRNESAGMFGPKKDRESGY